MLNSSSVSLDNLPTCDLHEIEPTALQDLIKAILPTEKAQNMAEFFGMLSDRVLRTMRLVSYRKSQRKVYYQLLDHHVLELYRSVSEHLDE